MVVNEMNVNRSRLILLSSILGISVVIAAVALIDVHFGRIVDWFSPAKDWVEFRVPADVRPIRASVKRVHQGMNVCNEDDFDWSEVTVKLAGKFGAVYVSQMKSIKTGSCGYVSFEDFAEPSWKRMQMSPNEMPTKIEVLVTYKPKGYVSLEAPK